MIHAVHLLAGYGYVALGGTIALESIGLPIPGETALIAAAIYAGASHRLDIGLIIASAATGAAVGGILSFWLGRELGYRLLFRCGRYIGLTERRIKLAQYLFQRHGGKIVFFGRFVGIFRALVSFLAGMNRMSWRRFLVFDVASAAVWAAIYGFGAFYFGSEMKRLAAPAAAIIGILAAAAVLGAFLLILRHESEWEDRAERALQGPLGRSDPANIRVQ